MSSDEPLLEIRNLRKYYDQDRRLSEILLRKNSEPVKAVDGPSLTLTRNESQAVIGESGCGKTTLLDTIVGLHDITDGEILYKGRSISDFSRSEWKKYRRNVQVIFQDPFNTLDPKLTVEETLKEQLKIHDIGDRDEHTDRIHRVLDRVQLHPPEKYVGSLPRELSGGEKQRVSIARALILEPDVLLADEPASMLDVSTQASILNTLKELIDDLGVAMLYISHDLSTVSYVTERVNVMYLGRIVEAAPTKQLIDDPKHPYAQALISAIPIPDPHHDRDPTELEGTPSDPIGIGEGCRFRDRCPERMEICEETPDFFDVGNEHSAACHLYNDDVDEEVKAKEADIESHSDLSKSKE